MDFYFNCKAADVLVDLDSSSFRVAAASEWQLVCGFVL